MPISIPTNIAGISVPGTINGPLAALYGNKHELKDLRYPRDLGSNPTKLHVIQFRTLVPKPSSEQPQLATNIVKVFSGLSERAKNALTSGRASTVADFQEQIKSNFGGLLTGQEAENVKSLINALTASDVYREPSRIINLYVPDNLNATYSAAYDDISLTESLGKPYFLAQAGSTLFDYLKESGEKSAIALANKAGNDPFVRTFLANIIQNRLGTSNLPELAAKQVGQALNPQLQVLFKGTGFRTFQFDFLLTPYSQSEADEIQKIIKEFKLAAAPRINTTAFFNEGLFLEVPDLFEIEFFYKGKVNDKVHRIGRCVLENINVDYAPNGWSSFNDGSSVQTRLSLQFKETIIIDKNRIQEGY